MQTEKAVMQELQRRLSNVAHSIGKDCKRVSMFVTQHAVIKQVLDSVDMHFSVDSFDNAFQW